MQKFLIFLLCFVLNASWAFGEKKAHLQFQPNIPVHLNSEMTLEISQSLPGLSLSTKGKQILEASLVVKTEHNDLPITRPPFDLTFILKSLKIDLQPNEEKISFDSNEMGSSLYLSQVSKLVDRPITISIQDHFKLVERSRELKQIVNELPMLLEVDPESLLVELFLHLFALGGEELTEGKVIERNLEEHSIPSLPKVIRYEITEIDDYNIHAKILGEIEKQKIQLKNHVQINEKYAESVQVTLSGTMQGKGKWNRDNAMLYDLEMNYDYSAMFKLGEWEWLMNIKLVIHNRTKR